MNKIILHLDINYFFAQVEEINNPYYKNKPIVVCNNQHKGIILTSNYVARKKQIYAADKIYNAIKKCPELIILKPNMDQYILFSKKFFNCIQYYFCKDIEYYSIDECYIDATELIKKYNNNVLLLVNEIYQTILKNTSLKISIGISDNKFLAKTANDISDKTKYYNQLFTNEIKEKLYDKQLNKIFSVGRKTTKYFFNKKIFTVADFLNYPNQKLLAEELKSKYYALKDLLNGKTSDELDFNDDNNKSYSLAETFFYSTNDYDVIKEKIINLANRLYHKLRIQNLYCKTYILSIRNDQKITTSRSLTSLNKINNEKSFTHFYIKLLNKYWDCESINQISIGVNHLYKDIKDYPRKQLTIFDN